MWETSEKFFASKSYLFISLKSLLLSDKIKQTAECSNNLKFGDYYTFFNWDQHEGQITKKNLIAIKIWSNCSKKSNCSTKIKNNICVKICWQVIAKQNMAISCN